MAAYGYWASWVVLATSSEDGGPSSDDKPNVPLKPKLSHDIQPSSALLRQVDERIPKILPHPQSPKLETNPQNGFVTNSFEGSEVSQKDHDSDTMNGVIALN